MQLAFLKIQQFLGLIFSSISRKRAMIWHYKNTKQAYKQQKAMLNLGNVDPTDKTVLLMLAKNHGTVIIAKINQLENIILADVVIILTNRVNYQPRRTLKIFHSTFFRCIKSLE